MFDEDSDVLDVPDSMRRNLSNIKEVWRPMLILALALACLSAAPPPSRLRPNSLLKNLSAEPVFLSSLKHENDVLVLVFASSHCPVTTQYWNRLKGTWYNFREKNVAMAIIGGNSDDSHTTLQATLKEFSLDIPHYWDEGFQIPRILDLDYTPSVVVVGKKWEILYRGRIDDSWRDESRVKDRYLDSAITQALSGEKSEDHVKDPFMGSRIRRTILDKRTPPPTHSR